jgi:tetratricopeptide (TPR) repeat protein
VVLLVALVIVIAAVYVEQRNSPAEQTLSHVYRTLPPEQQIELLKARELALAEQALRDFPAQGDAWILMGDLQRRLGRSAKAVEFWQKGLELSPRRADAYHSLGTIAAEKGEFEQAISCWRKGLELEARRPGLHRVIGWALISLGRHDEAGRELQEEIRLSPRCAESHYLLGDTFLQRQEYEQAKKYYQKAIELQPKYANAYYGLATACTKLGQLNQAAQYRASFTQLRAAMMEDRGYGHSPADDLARTRQSMAGLSIDAARLYLAAGKAISAEELLKQAVAVDPNNPTPRKNLAALYQRTGRLPEALAQCERIGQLEPDDPACQLLLGTLAFQLCRMDRAETAFKRFLTLCPNESAGYRELAHVYINTGTQVSEARRLAGKAVELEPSADNYFMLGLACRGANDRSAALAALQEAVQLAPGNREFKQMYDLVRNGR